MFTFRTFMRDCLIISLIVLMMPGFFSSAHASEPAKGDTGAKSPPSANPADNTAATDEKIISPVPGYAMLATGGVLLVSGIITGSLALSLNADLEDKCPDNNCFSPEHNDVDRLNALAAITDAFIPLSVTLFIAGSFLLVISKKSARKYNNTARSSNLKRLRITSTSIAWRF